MKSQCGLLVTIAKFYSPFCCNFSERGPYFYVYLMVIKIAVHVKYPVVLLFIPSKPEKKIASYLTISESDTTVFLYGASEPQCKTQQRCFLMKGTELMGQILNSLSEYNPTFWPSILHSGPELHCS